MAQLNLPFGIYRATRGDLDLKFRVIDDSKRDELITLDLVDVGHIIFNESDSKHYSLKTYPTYGDLTGVEWDYIPTESSLQNSLDLKYDKSGGTISGDVSVTGNLTVNGDTVQVDSEIVTADSVIRMNDGEVGGGITNGFSGLEIDRGTSDDFWLGFDEVREKFTVGKISSLDSTQIATTQVVATRDDSLPDQSIVKWDEASKKFVDSGKVVSDLDPITNNNQLTNGAGYITQDDVPEPFDQDLNTDDEVEFVSISGDGSGLTNLPKTELDDAFYFDGDILRPNISIFTQTINYSGGSQVFTLTFEPTFFHSVVIFFGGVSRILKNSEYTYAAPETLEVLITLDVGSELVLNYDHFIVQPT